jgi:hypothetical protein
MQRRLVSPFVLPLWLVALGTLSCGSGAQPPGPRPPAGDAAPPRPQPAADGAAADAGGGDSATPVDGPGEGTTGIADAVVPIDGGGGDDGAAAAEAGADATAGNGGIVVENLTAGETVPHDLVVLQGSTAGTSFIDVELGGVRTRWPVVAGQFRAMALLKLGVNQVALTAGNQRLTLPITYRPPTNPRFVRFLYLVSADGDGAFEGAAGEPTDQASALARLRVAARLMQAFTAETMRRAGFGRLTFRLARDDDHEPIVEVWKSRLTTAAARSMDGNALWSAFYQELAGLPDRASSVDVAVMSMTHYLPATKVTQAHTALGGGRLGLFGSGTLYAHASALDEVPTRFADARVVDVNQRRDDSAGRGSYWANYATGLGAMAHELGHVLSLPHPASHSGLMWRGFDNLNRTFVIAEPGIRGGAGLAPVRPMDEAGLDRSNAVRLRFHRWLAPDAVNHRSDQPPTVTVAGGQLRISSAVGLRHVQYIVAGEAAAHDEHLGPSPPAMITVPLTALRARLGGAALVDVSSMDDDGNIGGRDRIALPP